MLKNSSLHAKMFVLLLFVVLIATVPLMVYYLTTVQSLTRLGDAVEIERTLTHAVQSSSDDIDTDEAALALKKYRQFGSLKQALIRQVVLVSIGYFVVVVVVSLLVGYFFIARITRPLATLTRATGLLANDELGYRIEENAGGEIGTLISSFNTMAVKLRQAQQQKMVAERKATWQRVARTIAHEIKNPLTPIRLSTERLYEKYATGSADFPTVLKSTTSTILTEIGNLQKLVDTFHMYAKYPDPVFENTSVNKIAHDAAALFEHHGDIIHTALDPRNPACRVDPAQIRQALTNLISNAVDATENTSQPHIAITTTSYSDAVGISVADNGCGVSPHQQQKLFQPYFTTKSHGNGIGLALTERIVSLNGGTISFETQPGSGTTFFLRFPRHTTTRVINQGHAHDENADR